VAEFEGTPSGRARRFAVVASRFNERITRALAEGAVQTLLEAGAAYDDVDLVWVPGAWELPAAARVLLQSERYDALVAVGAVIRGETPHFDYVAGECARGIMAVQLATGIPIGFGILTTETLAQAEQRADPTRGDKGFEATVAALTVAAIGRDATPLGIGFRR
jgi:6,7-dimethyl-8-ribityllumazine synthase